MENWLEPEYEPGLVSVIVPCHNQERYLSACLKSVNEQEYRPLEVIVVDDGSSDGTKRIMNDFQNNCREGIVVKCLYQSKHGAQHARNRGCSNARGEFIQFLDGDDILFPGKLSDQAIILKKNNCVDVVYGDGQYLIDFGGPPKKGRIISIGPSSDIVESLLFGYWVPPFSYLNRRSVVQRCGPWDITIQVAQDFEYFLRMAMKGGRFSYKAGVTGFYRKHSFATLSERSVSIREGTRRRILSNAEFYLKNQGDFSVQRISAIVENYRRIARQTYPMDKECFKNSLNDVLRLCPHYLPKKRWARFVALIIGFINYEKVAALISRMLYKSKKDWY